MVVYNLWRMNKVSFEVAERDIGMSRDFRSPDVVYRMKQIANLEHAVEEASEQTAVQAMLRARQKPFLQHPQISEWLRDFVKDDVYGKMGRWKPLALIGDTNIAKSWKAMSLWPGETLKVSCNGLPLGILPSLKDFSRRKHRCICFDEVRPDQVLGNRELFQSGQWPVKLGQSACGQHEYQLWIYGVAIVLCANDFEVDQKSISFEEDKKWITENVIEVRLRPGQKWYMEH